MTGLLIHNEIKRNGWSAIAKLFKPQIKIYETNNKSSKKSNSKDKEPIETHNSDDKRNIIKKGFTNTWISNKRVFHKKLIAISVKKEKNIIITNTKF